MCDDGAPRSFDVHDITFGGERVSHLYPNDCYYAHLSIYRFALRYAHGRVVLDAGSGAGYGAAYLADHGAHFVWGIDVSPRAVAFSEHYLSRPNVRFQLMDLQKIGGFAGHHFDLVISSNTLEHVADVLASVRGIWSLLNSKGSLLVAVPPVTGEQNRAANLANSYHLNIWTPRQWYHVLGLFFAHVDCYRHGFGRSGMKLDFTNTPDQTKADEADFVFEPVLLEQFYALDTLTAVFVAREPRAADAIPSSGYRLTFVDDSFTRPFVLEGVALGEPNGSTAPTAGSWTPRCSGMVRRVIAAGRQGGLLALLRRSAAVMWRRLSGKPRLQ